MSPTLVKSLEKIAKTEGKRFPPPRKKRYVPEAFPDYGKSLVTQSSGDPMISGIIRALGYGVAGAGTGGAAAALASSDENKKRNVLLAALIGGALAGTAGYYSGSREQESENSKLRFYRRLGLDNPGEFLTASRYSPLAPNIVDKGVKI